MIDTSILQIAGPDAFHFLQGQLTCDMRKVSDSQNKSFGALCNSQGRVIAGFSLHKISAENYHLTLPTELIEKVQKTLKKYAAFADVEIDTLSLESPQINLLKSIQEKTPVILSDTCEKFTPHELNYHLLGWVSFDKGCYKGQEIIARMQYLGKLKKKLQHVSFKTDEEMTSLFADWQNNTINRVCNIHTGFQEALILLPVDCSLQALQS